MKKFILSIVCAFAMGFVACTSANTTSDQECEAAAVDSVETVVEDVDSTVVAVDSLDVETVVAE